MIILNQDSFDALWDATKLAAEAGQETVTVKIGKSRFHFNTEEAIALCDQHYNSFKGTPTRVYPENREGPEP